MEKWRTAISKRKDDELYVRGYSLSSLIGTRSFADLIFLLWRGSFPKKKEAKMLEAILVAASEHGLAAPSTFTARTIASCGNPLHVSIAGGIMALGEWHGGAIEKAAFYMQSGVSAKKIVADLVKRKERLPGFGHKVYKLGDPRVEKLFSLAKQWGFFGKFVRKALQLERELARKTGKSIPLNIDGAMAAILLELGFDWRIIRSFFILPRIVGLAAHAYEELVKEKPYRRLSEEDIEYIGPRLRGSKPLLRRAKARSRKKS